MTFSSIWSVVWPRHCNWLERIKESEQSYLFHGVQLQLQNDADLSQYLIWRKASSVARPTYRKPLRFTAAPSSDTPCQRERIVRHSWKYLVTLAGQCLLDYTGSNRFSFNNFKHFLTLFSKFFSSFPHGTCSLSVSRKYLALDEVYHLLCASISRSATLRLCTVRNGFTARHTGLSPSMMPYSKGPMPYPKC